MMTPFSMMLICVGFTGLIVGSFLNVVIYRLPRNKCIVKPRSTCPHCKKTIPFYLNIPILSFCLLRGQSACCNKTISIQYPLVELASMLLSMLIFIRFGASIELGFALMFVWLCICLVVIDLQHQILPDSLNYALLWLGLLANLNQFFAPLADAVIGAVAGYFALWITAKGYKLITKRDGMGHGDFKLLAALGAWFGWAFIPITLLIASSLGAVFGISYLLITKQHKHTPIAFGPCLCFAGMVVLCLQETIAQIAF